MHKCVTQNFEHFGAEGLGSVQVKAKQPPHEILNRFGVEISGLQRFLGQSRSVLHQGIARPCQQSQILRFPTKFDANVAPDERSEH